MAGDTMFSGVRSGVYMRTSFKYFAEIMLSSAALKLFESVIREKPLTRALAAANGDGKYYAKPKTGVAGGMIETV
jgi:hypothetical protein